MAEDKKSFILYSDLIGVVGKLIEKDRKNKTNNAGEFFYHILQYVCDLEPEPINDTIDLVFDPVKSQLKRDLKKWEARSDRSRENGAKGGRPPKPKKPEETQQVFLEPEKPDNVSVIVCNSVLDVNESDNEILLKKEPKAKNFNFKRNLIDLGLKENLVDDWLKVRKTKKLTNTETAFNNLKIEFDKSGKEITEIINHCVTQSWGGFKAAWKWEDSNSGQTPQQNNSGNLIHTN